MKRKPALVVIVVMAFFGLLLLTLTAEGMIGSVGTFAAFQRASSSALVTPAGAPDPALADALHVQAGSLRLSAGAALLVTIILGGVFWERRWRE